MYLCMYACIHACMYACMYMCVPEDDVVPLQNAQLYGARGWLRLVGSIKL